MTHPVTIRTTELLISGTILSQQLFRWSQKAHYRKSGGYISVALRESSARRYLRLNRVTDKKDVKKGLMTQSLRQISGCWHWCYQLHIGALLIYRNSHRYDTKRHISTRKRFSPLPGKSDPFNKTAEINIEDSENQSFLLIWLLNKRNGRYFP